ncbi:MAG: Uma2 family endonuclease [Candidatus Eremiobacteraeota bacterium]|nr:Uma2 family endonuclease [Candidatus Eremiobacteraeota bacterium]
MAQYHRMLEVGIVYEREPVELLDGQLIALPPEGPLHSSAVMALNELLVKRFADRAMVCPGNPVELDDTSEPQPDFTLVQRHDDWYKSGHPRPRHVFLVIEVSRSALAYDRGQKLRAYARNGIAEVRIVNLVHGQVEVYTEPHELGYGDGVIVGRDGTVTPRAFPDDAIAVAAFVP